LGSLYLLKREHDKAIAEAERAVALEPGGHATLFIYATCLTFAGRPEEAIPSFKKATRLSPYGPLYLYNNFGMALHMTGRFEEAVSVYKKAMQLSPHSIFPHLNLAATYSMMGHMEEARAEATEVLRINPKFSLDYKAMTIPYKDQSVIDKYIDALHKAGLK
jgi:adenylate cyclase